MMQYPVINGSTATYMDGEVVHELMIERASSKDVRVIMQSTIDDELVAYNFMYMRASDIRDMLDVAEHGVKP